MEGATEAAATVVDGPSEPTPEPAATEPLPALAAEDWQQMPVVPGLSARMLEVYARGQALGNNPRAFSKIGDGEISAAWFLTDFDRGPAFYDLGPYSELHGVIEYFGGSFGRASQAARRGFNTSRVLEPALANPEACAAGETPLACELRLHRPAFAIISLGTNQVWSPDVLEREMHQILILLLDQGVVPVIGTKADNLEGDHRINQIFARLALEYEVPLWNFWLAVQPLPAGGLQEDLEHLTFGPNFFGSADAMQNAWPVRNLTALQMLDALQLSVGE
jgi:hypothetical protein